LSTIGQLAKDLEVGRGMPKHEERLLVLEARMSRLEAHVAGLDPAGAARVRAVRTHPDARPQPSPESASIETRRRVGSESAGFDDRHESAVRNTGADDRHEATIRTARTDARAERAGRDVRGDSGVRAIHASAGGRSRLEPGGFEELVGGRVLGWVGGVSVLVGILFFLVVATSRGWISEPARVVMAAGASLLLLGLGAWLHERRGRNEAALAAAATGIAGLFATVVVAGPVYHLVPAVAALVAALTVGATATLLALRWRAQGIGWLGILGALVSPALVGAAGDGTAIALMLVAYAAAGAVLLWQRWHALGGTAFLVAVPQLAWWLLDWSGDDPSSGAVVAALVVFGVVTAAAAVGFEWRAGLAELRISAHVLLALNALALAGLGALGLGDTGTDVWLAAVSIAHVGAGLLARRSRRVTRELTLVAAALGIVLADVAFASVADGLPLVLGWAAGAVAFSALARRALHASDSVVALAGLSGHLLLAIATALTGAAPLTAAAGGADDPATALTALAALATAAWAAARLVAPRLPSWRLALDAIALAALGLFSAVALEGAALTLALAAEAAVLAALARRIRATAPTESSDAATGIEPRSVVGDDAATTATPSAGATIGTETAPNDMAPALAAGDPLPFGAALAFLAAAFTHALFVLGVLAPSDALIVGLERQMAAALGLGAAVVAALIVSRAAPNAESGRALRGGAAVTGLYLASALVVTPFRPDADAGITIANLDVRQQGQALLSALWGLTGVVTLVAGLLRDDRPLRLGALALLTVTVAKVFAYDLASLTSLYRVGSCIALGVLLLAGAFAWQRIRPRALPDLRDVPGALR
jgi:uncharacterized membrane protein